MWKPGATRNCNSTDPGLAGVSVTGAADAMVTRAPAGAGLVKSVCAASTAASNVPQRSAAGFMRELWHCRERGATHLIEQLWARRLVVAIGRESRYDEAALSRRPSRIRNPIHLADSVGGFMKKLLVFVLACLLATVAWADSLQLKNGSIIKGKYLGGTETEVSFQVGSTVQRYAVADIEQVTFDAASRSAAPATTSQAAPAPRPATPATAAPQLAPRPVTQAPAVASTAPASSPKSMTVPTGTRIVVRTIDAVDSAQNQVGDRFKASLEEPVIVNEVVVVPKGADVYGRLTEAKEAGQIQGRSQLKLELIGIVVNGQTIPLVTGD